MNHDEQVAKVKYELLLFHRTERPDDPHLEVGCMVRFILQREAALHKEYEQRDEQHSERVQQTGDAIGAFLKEHKSHIEAVLEVDKIDQLHDCLLEFVSKREAALQAEIEKLRTEMYRMLNESIADGERVVVLEKVVEAARAYRTYRQEGSHYVEGHLPMDFADRREDELYTALLAALEKCP